MQTLRFFLIIFVLSLSACEDPTLAIRADIAAFKTETPDSFYFTHSGGRKVRAAWAGLPTLRPLIFVHGSPGSWQGWAAFLRNKELQNRFHIIAVDRLGYGGSGAGQAEPALESQANAISQFLQENKSGLGAVVVGHSLGGPVAARIAMDFPTQVAALVLLASSVDPALEETKWFQIPAQWLLLKWMIPKDLKVCNKEILGLKDQLREMTPSWQNLNIPIAIVHGDRDDLVPVENVDFLKLHLKKNALVSVEIIQGMNHFIPWRNMESVLNAIRVVSNKVTL